MSWSTVSESENLGFEIQRSSDGITFQPIGWIDGSGDVEERLDYTFEDLTVVAGHDYFYRLRQEDFDGSFMYSSIANARTSGQSDQSVGSLYPNPTLDGQSNLELFPSQSGEWEVAELDLRDRLISSNKLTVIDDYRLIPIDLREQPARTYLVRIVREGVTTLKRIVR